MRIIVPKNRDQGPSVKQFLHASNTLGVTQLSNLLTAVMCSAAEQKHR